jgi:5-(carboxyamino)imidazole ribonucleotide synthase
MTNVSQFFSTSLKLGIIGGGQLGKMLLTETQKWDIYTCILDPVKEAPCASICNEFYQGNLMDFNTVYNFGKKVDVLTIEIEHVNCEALFQLEKEGLKIYPQPKVLETIQDKSKQKDFFVENNITTALYKNFTLKKSLLNETFEFPVIWKAARFGYDGTGVKLIRNIDELSKLPDIPCVIEEFVTIKKEFSVIVARNESGETQTYPVVEMIFHNDANQVEFVICPANIDETLAKKITTSALQVSEAFNHIGLLAIEFLLDNNGRLLVNEVAPRPHNSGHYSIEASYTNQFEQHLRAILNLPLGNTSSILPAVMVNLVGEEGFVGEVQYQNIDKILRIKGVTPHLYGKKFTRAFRKMGHATIVNEDIEKAKEIAKKVKRTLRVTGKQQISCD